MSSPRKYQEPRPDISADLRRAVALEAGHACAISHCGEHTYLEVHHINGNREDNQLTNLVLLCDKHHKMAHAGVIDRKALAEYKRILQRWARDMPELVQAPCAQRLPARSEDSRQGSPECDMVLAVSSISGLFILVAASRAAKRACGFPLAALARRVPLINAEHAQGFLLGLCCGGFLFPAFHNGIMSVSQLDPVLAARVDTALSERIAAIEDAAFREKLEFFLGELHAFFDAP